MLKDVALHRVLRLISRVGIEVANDEGDGLSAALHNAFGPLQGVPEVVHVQTWINVYCNDFEITREAEGQQVHNPARLDLSDHIDLEAGQELLADGENYTTCCTIWDVRDEVDMLRGHLVQSDFIVRIAMALLNGHNIVSQT